MVLTFIINAVLGHPQGGSGLIGFLALCLFPILISFFIVRLLNPRKLKQRIKSENEPDSFMYETDVLGLKRPKGTDLTSDISGIKNPQFTFQVTTLITLSIVAIIALKINTPEPFSDRMDMNKEEKRIDFRTTYYNGHPIYSLATCGYDYFSHYRPTEFKQAKPVKK